MIKVLKKGNLIYQNIDEKIIDENGNEVWNIPTNVDEFKVMAIDTISWKIGDNVKKTLDNTNTKLSAANAKAIALLAKLINTLNPDTSSLTPLELDNYNKLLSLANNGYADSKLLNNSLVAVETEIAKGVDKITRIQNATTLDEIIAILNEGEICKNIL